MSAKLLKKEESSVGKADVSPAVASTIAFIDYAIGNMQCFAITKNTPLRSAKEEWIVAAGTTFTENIDERYEVSSWMEYGEEKYGTFFEKNYMDQIVTHEEGGARPTNRIFPSVQVPYLKNGIRNIYVSINEDMLKVGLFPIMGRLMKFKTLKPGWNEEGSKPIEWGTIYRAFEFYSELISRLHKTKKVAPLPFIAPVDDGSIHFEWKTTYKELIVSIPFDEHEKINYLKVENTVFGEEESEGFVDSFKGIIDLIVDWLLESRWTFSR